MPGRLRREIRRGRCATPRRGRVGAERIGAHPRGCGRCIRRQHVDDPHRRAGAARCCSCASRTTCCGLEEVRDEQEDNARCSAYQVPRYRAHPRGAPLRREQEPLGVGRSGFSPTLVSNLRVRGARRASWPHGQAQVEGCEYGCKRVETRIAPLGERAIERLAAQPSSFRQYAHSTHGICHRTQRDRHSTRIAVGKHLLNVCRNLRIAAQMAGCTKRSASCAFCSLSSRHEPARCLSLVCAYHHHIAAG